MLRCLDAMTVRAHALSVAHVERCSTVNDLGDVVGFGGADGAAVVAELAYVLAWLG